MITREEVNNFMRKVPQDVVVVFDDAYSDYVEDKIYENKEFILALKDTEIPFIRDILRIIFYKL